MGNLNYSGIATDSPCQGVTIGAEGNVDLYQSAYSTYANSAIGSLNNVLKPLAVRNTGYEVITPGAADDPSRTEDAGISYSVTMGAPTFTYTIETSPEFAPGSVPNIVDIDYTQSITEPSDAPEADYKLRETYDEPGPLTATVDQTGPTITTPDIPDVPERALISDPKQFNITVPDLCSAIDIPDFAPQYVPNLNGVDVPLNDFVWEDEAYDSIILQQVKDRVSDILVEGHLGIPEYVWDTIWERGRDKVLKETRRSAKEISQQWAAKGFSLPQGAQLERENEVEYVSLGKRLDYNKEIVIKEAEQQFETLKYAIAEGQALEKIIGDWHHVRMARALDAAKFTYQSELEYFNGKVKLFEAEVSLFNVEAQVYKTQLEGELSKLQKEKLRLEYEQIKGDLNKQEVDLYIAKVSAYDADVKAYNAKISGIKSKIDAEIASLETYKYEVQAYGELVKTKSLEYQNAQMQIETDKAKVDMFQSEVQAYAAEVQAYSSRVQAATDIEQLKHLHNQDQYTRFKSLVETHDQNIKAKTFSLDSYVKKLAQQIELHKVKVSDTQHVKQVALEEEKLNIARVAQQVQVDIENARSTTQAAIKDAEIVANASDVLSKAYSQLAASAMGVIHVSAGISDSTSNSASCSTSYSASV